MFEAEDYQQLFGEINDGAPAPATVETAPAEPTSVADPVPAPILTTPDATPIPEGEPTGDGAPAQEPTPEADPVENPQAQAQAKAFAELRANNSKYSKVFKQLQGMMQVGSEDEVIERLLNAGIQAQARQTNTDPEVLRRMQSLEDQNLRMLNENKQKAVVESFGLLQKEFNLTNDEVRNFAVKLAEEKIDIFNIGVNLNTLYRGMNHDTLKEKAVETAKQTWIADDQNASKAPGVIPITGKKPQDGKTKIDTMGELENLFNNSKLN